ncbi:MAG: acetyl-CoA carboxylase biotin carboxyl carrier protein [Candidatus Eiseniibacteriota bacterium]|nr:MAG: acetyl-CoA carboxylase biotin carboxyl carrier protein [Candidatus Eisenbacteria bacterium]
MKVDKIRELIRVLEESGIEEIEVSSWGQRIRVSKSGNSCYSHPGTAVPIPKESEPKVSPQAVAAQAPSAGETTGNLLEIKSPMVGTFYRAQSPGAEPFVETDSRVDVGQTVCIIEAMKLMNEIQSEVSGRIARILIENAQPVEYGQTLFLVEPR